MTNENDPITVDFGAVDIFPAFVDYDFKNDRPRGGSCRVDFFCHGALFKALRGVRLMPSVFVRKENIFFEKGFFLLDFSRISEEADAMARMISEMGEKTVYIEETGAYDVTPLVSKLENADVTYLRFIPDYEPV